MTSAANALLWTFDDIQAEKEQSGKRRCIWKNSSWAAKPPL
jgi:hypothetical protein